MAPRSRLTRGFVSAESLVALAVLAAALVPAASLLYTSRVAKDRAEQRAGLQQSARAALEAMTRHVRLAGSDFARVIPQQANPVAIQEATSSALTLIGDMDRPGQPTKVRYRYDEAGKRILREVWRTWNGGTWGTSTGEVAVGAHVSRLAFTYFTANDQIPTLPADLGQIRRVVVDITASDWTPAGGAVYRVSSGIRIRGLD